MATLGRRLTGDEEGAIVVLIAGVVGSALLVCLIAMGVEFGRAHVVQGQVQSAGDSALLAVTQQCYNASKTGARCGSAAIVRDLAKLSVMPQPTWADNQVQLVGVCVETSTATGEKCSGFTSVGNSSTSVDISSCAALPAGTQQYLRIVVEAASPFNGFFVTNTKFRQCVQSKWVSGVTKDVPNPFILGACFYNPGGLVYFQDDNANSNQQPAVGSCVGNDTATALFPNLTLAANSLAYNLVGSVGSAGICGATGSITIPVTLTTGLSLGSNNDICEGATNSLYPGIKTWLSGTPQWVALSGNYLSQGSLQVNIIAFAKFDLYAYNPGRKGPSGSTGSWVKRGDSVAGGTWPTGVPFPDASICSSPDKNVCLYGRWLSGAANLVTAGTGTSAGIELIQ